MMLNECENIASFVVRSLIKYKATIALAESCTGGLIAHRITNIAGSSACFAFSAVTYSNESKTKILNVSAETLEYFGAVHEKTASEMAEGARVLGNTTYGLSTTGIAGPSGGTSEKPVGTICIGLATPRKTIARRFYFPSLDRLQNKEAFARTALNLLLSEMGYDQCQLS